MKSVILDVPPFHSDGAQREFEEFSSTLPGPEPVTAKYGGGRPHPRDVSRLAYAVCGALALLTVWPGFYGDSDNSDAIAASPTAASTTTPQPSPSPTSSPYERGQRLVDDLGQVHRIARRTQGVFPMGRCRHPARFPSQRRPHR